ncbi:MAG: AMP-binding protein [Schaedlerella sp.]|nr:AMP-binding protein [Schaedlerella sp.]
MYEKELGQLKKLYENGLYKANFYSRKIKDASVFESYEKFQEIPFTYKPEIRESGIMERTATEMKDIYGVFSSSGTTGNKTFYIYNKNDKKVHEEFVKEFLGRIGINENDLGGIMAPVDTGVMAHTMMWEFTTMGAGYVNCPEPSPENIVDVITKVPVTAIATRPNVVSNVVYNPETARAAKESTVKKLLLGGGFLSKERRKLLEETWDADCYNMFGMSEMFGPMAGECPMKNGLHFLNQYLMIELVDPITLQPVKEGEVGIAIYTTLWEKGFPLLRYWTDDMMKITYESCECGSVYPRLYYLGRLADYIDMNGKYIFPEMVENVLFSHGFYGDYKIYKENDEIVIKTESMEAQISAKLQTEMNQLFEQEVTLEIVMPRSLGYSGHGNRIEKN